MASEVQRQSFTRLAVLLAAVALVLGAMHVAAPVVTPIILATVLALILRPVYAWLRQRHLGTFAALAALFGTIVVATALVVVILGYSLSQLSARLTTYADNLAARLQSADAWLASQGLADAHLDSLLPQQAIVSAFAALVASLASAAITGLFVLLLLMFLLAEGPAIARRLRASLDDEQAIVDRLARFGTEVAQYFLLRAAVNAVTGVGVALVLWALGVDFPVLWGIVTFFLSFVPYIGMFLASVPSVLLAWAEYDLTHALVVVVALTVVNATAENIVQPALMHKGLSLSPTFVLASVFFWSWVLGPGGAFLAIPMSLGLLALLTNFTSARWFVSAVTSHTGTSSN